MAAYLFFQVKLGLAESSVSVKGAVNFMPECHGPQKEGEGGQHDNRGQRPGGQRPLV